MREQGAPHAGTAAQAAPSFTEEQAERGHAAYAHNCLDCHGSNLDNGEFGGPPLKGLSFARHWDAANVAALFSFMKAKMPPDRPGQLNDETYADHDRLYPERERLQARRQGAAGGPECPAGHEPQEIA